MGTYSAGVYEKLTGDRLLGEGQNKEAMAMFSKSLLHLGLAREHIVAKLKIIRKEAQKESLENLGTALLNAAVQGAVEGVASGQATATEMSMPHPSPVGQQLRTEENMRKMQPALDALHRDSKHFSPSGSSGLAFSPWNADECSSRLNTCDQFISQIKRQLKESSSAITKDAKK